MSLRTRAFASDRFDVTSDPGALSCVRWLGMLLNAFHLGPVLFCSGCQSSRMLFRSAKDTFCCCVFASRLSRFGFEPPTASSRANIAFWGYSRSFFFRTFVLIDTLKKIRHLIIQVESDPG
eukprot:2211917-Rhodomonas_salina.1